MKLVGVVSYNINCNFTNYGSALQSWALCRAIQRLGYEPVLVDYCPKVLEDANALDPIKRMWDKDDGFVRLVEMSMPAIKENFYKFENFYSSCFRRTAKKYYDNNFFEITNDEHVKKFVCGSDTIFCIDEFKGFVDGYYANFDCMKGNSVSYAASFGDIRFSDEEYGTLKCRLQNFKALGLRENDKIKDVKSLVDIPVQRTIDPTLLLNSADYDTIATKRLVAEKYLLLYSRRQNVRMYDYAEKIAKEQNLKIVDISLKAVGESDHIPYYHAGVEEFLSLVKYAECVVTNSFHGIIFSVQYKRQFYGFIRQECSTKINELMELFGLKDGLLVTGDEEVKEIDYEKVHSNIDKAREKSLLFLKTELELLND